MNSWICPSYFLSDLNRQKRSLTKGRFIKSTPIWTRTGTPIKDLLKLWEQWLSQTQSLESKSISNKSSPSQIDSKEDNNFRRFFLFHKTNFVYGLFNNRIRLAFWSVSHIGCQTSKHSRDESYTLLFIYFLNNIKISSHEKNSCPCSWVIFKFLRNFHTTSKLANWRHPKTNKETN